MQENRKDDQLQKKLKAMHDIVEKAEADAKGRAEHFDLDADKEEVCAQH